MKAKDILLNILLTPFAFVICITLAVLIAAAFIICFPFEGVAALWKEGESEE